MDRWDTKKRIFVMIAAMIFFFLLRVWLQKLLGAHMNYAPDDDFLMVSYALPGHWLFPNRTSLLKYISFPLFLKFIYHMGISYSAGIVLLYGAAGLSVYAFARTLRWPKKIAFLFYLYVLFLPVGFSTITTRLYRHGILPPLVILLFSLLLIQMIDLVREEGTAGSWIIRSVFIGLIGTYTIYIKEDGIWIAACMALAMLVQLIIITVRIICALRKKSSESHAGSFIKRAVICILPLLIFLGGTLCYKAVNAHYFGVFETNTRTEGETAGFMNRVYRIASEDRTDCVWAPTDAIDQAVACSPTLRSYPLLLDLMYHFPALNNDIRISPIPGDFLGWVLNWALGESGVWQSEAQVQELFAQINAELDAAFEDGRLQEDDRFQLVASSGGKTREEILALRHWVDVAYRAALIQYGYSADRENVTEVSDLSPGEQEVWILAAALSGEGSILSAEKTASDHAWGSRFARADMAAYRVVNVLFMLCSVAAWFAAIVVSVSRRTWIRGERLFLFLGVFFLMGIGTMYAFAVSWFSSFVGEGAVVAYTCALPGILVLVYVLGLSLLKDLIPEFRRKEACRG